MNKEGMRAFIVFILGIFSCVPSFSQMIIDKPIVFDETRKELSLLYMKERYGLEKAFPVIEPKIIVVHWTGLNDLDASHKIMEAPTLSSTRTDIQKGGNLNVSAHYLVARNGDIYRMLPDTVFARHVIGLNYYAIGIENVGNVKNPLTQAQLEANVQLIKMLKEKHDIEFLIGHYEYKKFINHPLWLEKDSSYLTEKTDPGISFMRELRKLTSALDFSELPDEGL